MKGKTLLFIGLGCLIIICCCIIIAGGLLALGVFSISQAPYSIEADKMTAEYINELESVGSYERVEDEFNGPGVADFSETGEPAGEIVTVVVGDDITSIDSLEEVEAAAKELSDSSTCTTKSHLYGFSGTSGYYRVTCNEEVAYLYVDTSAGRAINIFAQGGGEQLEEFIEAYQEL